MKAGISREDALALLKAYNKEPFHWQHALTVEAVMGELAEALGYGEDKEFWQRVGLLHDIDYEMYPDTHLEKTPEILQKAGGTDALIHAVISHGYGICADVAPEHEMEKVLYAVDELTGLIGASVLMRPSKSVQDMGLKSVKKKFKDKHFARGCNRDTIAKGAEMLNWELDELFEKTLEAMKKTEASINETLTSWKEN